MNALLERLSIKEEQKQQENTILFTDYIYKMLGCHSLAVGAYYMGTYKFEQLLKAGYQSNVAALHAMSYGIMAYSLREEQEEVKSILYPKEDE